MNIHIVGGGDLFPQSLKLATTTKLIQGMYTYYGSPLKTEFMVIYIIGLK
jgi:hypothetical protein